MKRVAWLGAILLPLGHFWGCFCLDRAEEGWQGMPACEDMGPDPCFPLQAQMMNHALPEGLSGRGQMRALPDWCKPWQDAVGSETSCGGHH